MMPLHAKDVPRLRWQFVDSLMPGPLKRLWEYYRAHYLGDKLQALPISRSPKIARLSCYDISELLAKRFIREIPFERVRNYVNVFTVPEWSKARRRFIAEPFTNDSCMIDEQFRVHLPGPREIINKVATFLDEARRQNIKPKVSCADISFWFGHMSIPEEVQELHCFQVADGRFFALETVPTGGRHVVGLAQLSSEAIVSGQHCAVEKRAAVYIDNILRLFTDPVLAYEDTLAFFHTAANLGVQLNETFLEVLRQHDESTSFVFLGLHYDLAARRVSLSDKLKQKLILAAERIGDEDITWLEVQQIAGLMNFAQTLDFNSRARCYHILKFLRRRAAACFKDHEQASVWPCLRLFWADTLRKLANAESSLRLRKYSKRIRVTTDASLHGWAAIIQTEDGSSVIAGQWDDSEKNFAIQELELEAVLRALDRLEMHQACIDIRVDNTSALWALASGTSKSYWMAARVAKIHSICKTKNFHIRSIEYIKSQDNDADYWSRIFGQLPSVELE